MYYAVVTMYHGTSLGGSESQVQYNLVYYLCAENVLCSGDHVSWHTPLDGSESRVQHMLMTEDAQLQPITTPFGIVNFIQVKPFNATVESLFYDSLKKNV